MSFEIEQAFEKTTKKFQQIRQRGHELGNLKGHLINVNVLNEEKTHFL